MIPETSEINVNITYHFTIIIISTVPITTSYYTPECQAVVHDGNCIICILCVCCTSSFVILNQVRQSQLPSQFACHVSSRDACGVHVFTWRARGRVTRQVPICLANENQGNHARDQLMVCT